MFGQLLESFGSKLRTKKKQKIGIWCIGIGYVCRKTLRPSGRRRFCQLMPKLNKLESQMGVDLDLSLLVWIIQNQKQNEYDEKN